MAEKQESLTPSYFFLTNSLSRVQGELEREALSLTIHLRDAGSRLEARV